MSERGTFVTDFIYCDDCLESVKRVLVKNTYDECSIFGGEIQHDGTEFCGVSGVIFASGLANEISAFALHFIPALQESVCHPLRVAVFADCGDSRIFTVNPKNPKP